MSYDGSTNPEDFPAPSTRINKVNSAYAGKWKSAWDNTKVTASQIINNLRDDIFLYEVYGFYNLFYGNNSFIRNTTADASRLNLKVDITSNRTYPGPNMDYKSTQAKSSNYVLSSNLNSSALFAKTLRKVAYAGYMST